MKLTKCESVRFSGGHSLYKMTFDLGDKRKFSCYVRSPRHGFRQARKFLRQLRKLEQS